MKDLNKSENKFLELIVFIIIFFVSFFNIFTLITFFIYLFYKLFKEREIGAIKILNLLTIRQVLNPGIAVNFGVFESLKWILIMLCSFLLITTYNKLVFEEQKLFHKIFKWFLIFIIYTGITSLIFSSFPMVALLKIIGYCIPFTGLLLGVIYTHNKFNWITWLTNIFSVITLFSIPLISNPVGYLRNGTSFQGLINHPNLFGVFLVLYIALNLVNLQMLIENNKSHLKYYFNIIIAILLIIATKSRTSLGSVIILLLIFIIFSRYALIKKLIFTCLTIILALISIPFIENIINYFTNFFIKGADNIFQSRTNQIGTLLEAFLSNPFFGRGFSVPYAPIRSYILSTDLIVEPGNLFMAVLAYGGILGMIFFLIFLAAVITSNINGIKLFVFLPVSVVLICMGEMVFFSTNNIGIFCYMFFAIYCAKGIIYLEE
ncbi:O-antigen ligase family protein [Aerococcus urinaeequi]|uniref:O-antigen ligase family protein n=1 Tax=Aerococcus urinaeequi TaxID=51665 RepID=UPI003D6AA051